MCITDSLCCTAEIGTTLSIKVKSLSRVRLFATAWTVAYQAPLSMEFSRQKYWRGLPFPSPGDLPDQGSNAGLPHCRQMLYRLSHQGSHDPERGIFVKLEHVHK